jgi:hypothetical protein
MREVGILINDLRGLYGALDFPAFGPYVILALLRWLKYSPLKNPASLRAYSRDSPPILCPNNVLGSSVTQPRRLRVAKAVCE